MYREMDMGFWLEQAEAELNCVFWTGVRSSLPLEAEPISRLNWLKRCFSGPLSTFSLLSHQERTFVSDGCLMAYGPSLPDMFRRAAYYADRIQGGAKPADLPMEQTAKFELVVNLRTAKALGLTIPQSVLVRAHEIIR